MDEHIKTMNPADKFMSPRQPPPTPLLPRLNSSSATMARTRPTRSVSPKPERSPWSPKSFFGIRAPLSPAVQNINYRARSSSLGKTERGAEPTPTPSLNLSEEVRSARSVPQTRDVSPQSFKRSHSREPSLLHQVVHPDPGSYCNSTLEIPEEITEEPEDDENFASNLDRLSVAEKGIITPLSPPPNTPRPVITRQDSTDKPLPQLPEESFLPAPLRIRVPILVANLEPKSHFSTSTISTAASPAGSHFTFSCSSSFTESLDDENIFLDISGSDLAYSPVLPGVEDDSFADPFKSNGFNGYSLPGSDYASELTLRKEAKTPITSLEQKAAGRTTFGGQPPLAGLSLDLPDGDDGNLSTMEQLLSDMGYLGDAITGK
jgi:hypothetical protein